MPAKGPSKNPLAVLLSGRGSNLVAILDRIAAGELDASVVLVISNVSSSAGLQAARARGVPTLVVDHRRSPTREAHDRDMAAAIETAAPRLVCLAGYMRLLSPWFVERFAGCVMNIHPSLLPSFPGRDAQRQAIDAGVKISGCTVHFVDDRVDGGPIILQAAVPVLDDDTPEALGGRILEEEHVLYSRAIALHFSGRLRVEGGRVLGTTGNPGGERPE